MESQIVGLLISFTKLGRGKELKKKKKKDDGRTTKTKKKRKKKSKN